jgi:hypothetical protein
MVRAVVIIILVSLVAPGVLHERAGGATPPSTAQTAAIRAIDEASASLSQLETIHASTVQLNKKMSAMYAKLDAGIAGIGKVAASPGVSSAQLVQAVKQLQET